MANKIRCPYCYHEFGNSWEYFDEDFKSDDDTTTFNCEECGKDFQCTLDITYHYECEKIEDETENNKQG